MAEEVLAHQLCDMLDQNNELREIFEEDNVYTKALKDPGLYFSPVKGKPE